MGGPAATSRGEMIHLVLTLCRKFETAFAKLIDGGKGGASSCKFAWSSSRARGQRLAACKRMGSCCTARCMLLVPDFWRHALLPLAAQAASSSSPSLRSGCPTALRSSRSRRFLRWAVQNMFVIKEVLAGWG